MRLLYTLRDQDWATTKSIGILKFSLALVSGLARDSRVERLDVLANSSVALHVPVDLPKTRVHLADRAAPRGWSRLVWDQWGLVACVDELRPDWLLLPKGFAPLLRWPRTRVSAYVHDDVFSFYADQSERPWSAFEWAYFRRSLRRTLDACDAIVTPSKFVAGELAQRYRSRTPPQAIGEPLFGEPAPAPTNVDPRHLLIFASPYPHKLTAQALAWLTRFADETDRPLRVTAVGALPSGLPWPGRQNWTLHGRLTEAELRRVRAECGTLVYLSAYEGFGLPPLEALRNGQRAIASDLPPHREHLPAEVLFDNADYASFRATLERALDAPPRVVKLDSADTVAARWIDVLTARAEKSTA